MRKIQKQRSARNRRIVVSMTVVSLLLALSLPYSPKSQAGAKTKTSASKDSSQIRVEEKTIERKNLSNEVTGRLQVIPENHNEATFNVENIEHLSKPRVGAKGKVRFTKKALFVEIREPKSNTRVAMKFQALPSTPEVSRITLWFNGAHYKLKMDMTRAQNLGKEITGHLAEGNQTQAMKLASKSSALLSSAGDYLAFVKQIKDSPAFDAVALTTSLLVSAKDEIGKSLALSAINHAVKLFAPSAYKSQWQNHLIGKTQNRVVKVSYTEKLSSIGISPSMQITCDQCLTFFAALLFACDEAFSVCISGQPPDPTCQIIYAACLAAASAFLIDCSMDCT